ncbi:maleylpyruvate isomerase family mycothiol-dependent enzyme [Saccharopolyspora rhizosphaerae]|uniref:Maleylpyruvate isomerase family mycothiol-dependent enzyme n=2 Tax=Saccharopolyspora rhizosphaerae TaxID=2492662 RepID=A0A3R8Q755_9PSEU|nr:maleylpyruvate isomerase family mycothiol-dependent enzyme [Saccharopolyspora rhizosphaerae]
MFASLTPEQWRTPSLCGGWTVREVAAHLLAPLESRLTWPRVLLSVLRYRGDLDRYVDEQTREWARRPTDELVAGLRRGAGTQMDVPFVGPYGPMTDTCIHLRDAARPLGLDVNPPPRSWRAALDFLVSKTGARAFFPAARLTGLRLTATDQDWAGGEGTEVCGPSEALALAITGRPVALADLEGPGVDVLSSRITA